MKRYIIMLSALSVLSCAGIAGSPKERMACGNRLRTFTEDLPADVTSIEVSGSYDRNDMRAWGLDQDEIDKLRAEITRISLGHHLDGQVWDMHRR